MSELSHVPAGVGTTATGLVLDVKRYAIHDGPGIRTTVFLAGCPLACWWCHNPESQSREPRIRHDPSRCLACGQCEEVCPAKEGEPCRVCGRCVEACPTGARERVARLMTTDEVLGSLERDRVFHEESGGGATFSGGEPLLQPEFLLELLRGCGDRGIHRAVDTCGYAEPDVLTHVAEETDLFLFDLKAVDAALHRRTTGRSNELILRNLAFLAERDAPLEIRYPLVPGVSDGEESVDRAGALLRDLPGSRPVRVLPFHPAAEDKHARFGLPWRGGDAVAKMGIEDVRQRLRGFGLPVIGEETAG